MNTETVLQTYSLEEILEYNEVTEEEALEFLIEAKFISIPDPRPVDLYD